MIVPLLDLKAQHAQIRDEVYAAIERVVEAQWFILGPEVEALEEEVARYSDVAHGVGMSSGTDALLASLMAVGVGPGDEVVTTPYTFFASAGVIARLGAIPVFADIDPTTFNMLEDDAIGCLTPRTKAVVVVHLFGRVAPMDRIIAATKPRGIPVIEDAAQAIGARTLDGRVAGSVGDLGCFSFFPSKNLGGAGDGGMVVTNDAELADHLRVIRVHGSRPKYYHHLVGGNFRLDALQAAVLRAKMGHLDDWTRGRRENAARYRASFLASPLADFVSLPPDEPGMIYNQFVIRVPDRDRVRARAQVGGVSTEIYYPVPLHLQPCFSDLGYGAGDFPNAELAADETLALPIYPELTGEQQDHVTEQVLQAIRHGDGASR